jgi:serine phosphatase RsbU (regulator of sigma subunit)
MGSSPRIPDGEPPRAKLPRAPALESSEEIRVLLVEDDDADALLVDDLLSEALPRARIARSRTFSEALTSLDVAMDSELAVDCVLLDLKLPDAEGLDTVTRLRELTPQTPLIVLTGLNDEAAGMAAVDAGAQDYLVKGDVDGGQLARAIRYAIVRRQAADAQQRLRLADVQSREVARLERGLAPRPLVGASSVWIATHYRSGSNRALLGGDFLDVAEAPEGRLRVVVGDVCGHGPDEAAIGVCLRAAWRALAVAGVDSTQVAPALERILEHEREIPLLFTTLCMLEIELSSSTAQMVLAGHPAPILIDDASVSAVEHGEGGAPIGLGDGSWSPARVELPAQWVLLLYTDGITEGRVGRGAERLGTEGLERVLAQHIQAHPGWRERPDELLAALVVRAEKLNGGELTDDVAMLLIGSRTPSTETA